MTVGGTAPKKKREREDVLSVSLLSLLTVQATGNKWGKGKAKNTHQQVLSQF
jgi:hypothetical protein